MHTNGWSSVNLTGDLSGFTGTFNILSGSTTNRGKVKFTAGGEIGRRIELRYSFPRSKLAVMLFCRKFICSLFLSLVLHAIRQHHTTIR